MNFSRKVCLSLLLFNFNSNGSTLDSIFKADQAARELAKTKQIFPTMQEERKRRMGIFELLANGEIKTSEDYIKAAVVLQHTNLEQAKDGLKSVSAENHLLVFQLAKKAYQLGDRDNGLHYMVWSYNYFLTGIGCKMDIYGVKKKAKFGIEFINKNLPMGERIKCGWVDPYGLFEISEKY